MKMSEIRQLDPKKIHAELKKARRDAAVKGFHVKTGQNQNTAQLKNLKKAIARIKTYMNELANNPVKK